MRREQYGERDLTIKLWHRTTFDDDGKAFDVDLVGMCGRCDQPLYCWEETRSAQYKPTTWLQRTAIMLNVPAFLIAYETTESARCPACGRPEAALTFNESHLVRCDVFLLVPFQGRRYMGDLKALQRHIEDLRIAHLDIWHRNPKDTT